MVVSERSMSDTELPPELPSGLPQGLPPGFTPVRLPKVLTAMETFDLVKPSIVNKDTDILIIANWQYSGTCLQLNSTPRGNIKIISMGELCPLCVLCSGDKTQKVVICLQTDDPEEPNYFLVPTDSTQHTACPFDLQSSDTRPIACYARVNLYHKLYTDVSGANVPGARGKKVPRLLVKVDIWR